MGGSSRPLPSYTHKMGSTPGLWGSTSTFGPLTYSLRVFRSIKRLIFFSYLNTCVENLLYKPNDLACTYAHLFNQYSTLEVPHFLTSHTETVDLRACLLNVRSAYVIGAKIFFTVAQCQHSYDALARLQ